MRGLVTFTAKYASRCPCGGDIIRGDTVSRSYGRSRSILCNVCTRKAKSRDAFDTASQGDAYAQAKRLQTPDE